MIIAWRYICIFRHPVNKQCLLWIRIPIIVWFERIFERPRPDPPWLAGVDLRPEIAHDLQVLATIDALAQTLSDDRKKGMLEFMQKQFDSVELPEGMKILSEQDLRGKQ